MGMTEAPVRAARRAARVVFPDPLGPSTPTIRRPWGVGRDLTWSATSDSATMREGSHHVGALSARSAGPGRVSAELVGVLSDPVDVAAVDRGVVGDLVGAGDGAGGGELGKVAQSGDGRVENG